MASARHFEVVGEEALLQGSLLEPRPDVTVLGLSSGVLLKEAAEGTTHGVASPEPSTGRHVRTNVATTTRSARALCMVAERS